MRKILFFLLILFAIGETNAQGFSFNCARDTLIPGCPANLCITLKTLIPDPSRQAPTYAVGSSGQLPSCLLASANPGVPGAPTSLDLDDRYSAVFPIGFPFTFFGTTQSSLVVSSNGYICFDLTKTGTFSHYGILRSGGGLSATTGTPENLPSTLYDKGLIMGPYHDIDIGITTSPTRLISYQTSGLAPYRKWILNYYKIPLFSAACNPLFQNTHQIILYESTGIVDINIFDKQICTGWNQGRAMVGMQDMNRTSAVMAPGRQASDAPWGSVGMNESWRFTPTGGIPLFRRVELYDMAGTLISTGTTVPLPTGDREVSFPNVCPPSASSTPYVIKAFYDKIDDPTTEIVAYDTININRLNGLLATATTTPANCANPTGSITVASVNGGLPPYQYSLNGGPAQVSNVFTGLASGIYTVTITDASGCIQPITVTVPSITGMTGTATPTPTGCPGANNGIITATATSGTAPYQYSINGGPFQLSNVFGGLAPGTYTITFKDANGCLGTATATVVAGASLTGTAVSTDATCAGVNNGTITITPTSGAPPHQFSADGGPFQLSNVLTGLAPGNHTITFKDANNCTGTLTVFVGTGSGILFTTHITPPSCAGAANGSITINTATGSAPFSYSIDGGTAQLSNIFNGVAAGTHSILITDAVGCTGSVNVSMPAGVGGLTGNAVPVGTSCPGVNNGSITVTPTNGLAPYQYSLNGGAYQGGNIFSGLAAGTYTIGIKDASNCSGTLTVTVAAGVNLTATSAVVNPPCAGINNGSITVTPTTGTAPYQYSINFSVPQSNNTFTGLAAPATYNISFTDAIGCSGTISVSLVANTAISTTVAAQNPLCFAAANGNVTLNPAGGVSPFQFSKDGGATFQPSNVFSGLTAGTYTFRITDNVGCIKDTVVTLSQPSLLTASAAATASTCNGNDGTIVVTGGGGTTGYQYSVDGGATYQNSNSFTLAPGNYSNIIVKDANGCTANTAAVVSLVDAMFLNAGNDTVVCVGSGVTLQPITNTETSVFTWTPAVSLNNGALKNPVASPTDTTQYVLTAQWGLCTRKDSLIVNVLHKPIANAGNDTAICYKTFALLQGSASNTSGPVSYAWSPATKAFPPNTASSTARPDSTLLYLLTVKDNYGCNFTVTDDKLVTMQPPVPAYAGNDTNAIYGVPHQMFSSGGVSYLWSPAGPLNNPTAQFPIATLYNDTYFTVTVTDIAGCKGTDGVFIKAYKGPTYYVPNAFSPNGDGLNDIFRPTPVGMVSTEYFRVFNRYGELIFETKKWMDGWDGTFKGKKQPQGSYVWLIKGTDKNGKIVEMKGTVLLLPGGTN